MDIQLIGVSKKFGKATVVDRVNLTVDNGELVTFLGPSGCGKTTTLRMIAGLEHLDEGEIRIGGRSMHGVPPWKRGCGLVFQNYALFPHLSVADNIAYGLKLRKKPAAEVKRRVDEVAELMGLSGLLNRFPRQLSGGQQQRVAVARALAVDPSVLLMDEPLANLDAKLRERVRFELRALQQRTKVTSIYVTHDQAEAFVLSDRVVVMNGGRIEQVGTPLEIYRHPATEFVADFIGSNNVLKGQVVEYDCESQQATVQLGALRLQSPALQPLQVGQEVTAVIRTEDFELAADGGSEREANSVTGTLRYCGFLGNCFRLEVDVDGFTLKADVPSTGLDGFHLGRKVSLRVKAVGLIPRSAA